MSRFEKEILPFMEEEIMRKLRTYNVYSIMDYCGIDTRFMYCESNDRRNPMRKPNTGMLCWVIENGYLETNK